MLFGMMVLAFILAHPIITILIVVAFSLLLNIGSIYEELIS